VRNLIWKFPQSCANFLRRRPRPFNVSLQVPGIGSDDENT
jgi:hypothetical protein